MIVQRETVNNVIISTVRPPAMAWYGTYETAISLNNQEDWLIVEGYDTESEALEGHQRVRELILEGKVDEIKTIG